MKHLLIIFLLVPFMGCNAKYPSEHTVCCDGAKEVRVKLSKLYSRLFGYDSVQVFIWPNDEQEPLVNFFSPCKPVNIGSLIYIDSAISYGPLFNQ